MTCLRALRAFVVKTLSHADLCFFGSSLLEIASTDLVVARLAVTAGRGAGAGTGTGARPAVPSPPADAACALYIASPSFTRAGRANRSWGDRGGVLARGNGAPIGDRRLDRAFSRLPAPCRRSPLIVRSLVLISASACSCLDEGALLLVVLCMRLRRPCHALDIASLSPPEAWMRICCPCRCLSLAETVDDAVGVDVEGGLDLRHAARRRGQADEVERTQELVVGGHLALAWKTGW